MPPFTSTSKVVGSLISRRNGIKHLVRHAGDRKSHQIRCFSGIAGFETPLMRELMGSKRQQDVCSSSSSSILSNVNNLQRRSFLGVGDGEEGNVLSKVYEERRVLGYSPEQLFNVVAAVDLYHDFLPWCQRSEVVRHYPDGSFDAELEIGFKFFVESYVSHVELERLKRVVEYQF
ncbi:hypothetical protein TIFTF001_005119 [Ficus carica]|uniref:Coenzyme Q-binding protein COQ10 START domain-containing protein n=1 Tax=Ficus carica TaxID=3494 RepID=A0AA88CYY7_FICCA|nr:hypothetical protein TIFTF001_005119 [Ficus carica]